MRKDLRRREKYAIILNKEYPENPIFEKYLYNSYIGQGKWDPAIEGWKKIIKNRQ